MPIHDAPLSQDDFHLRWSLLGAPQRPTASVVYAMASALADRPGRGLQLGVTPEIARLSSEGFALDHNLEMIRLAWPGDCNTHQALVGDWLAMPFCDDSMAVAFGDGCLSMLSWPDDYVRLMTNVVRVLKPGGRLVLRCFVGPEASEPIEALVKAAHAGEIASFGDFKLRLNMTAFQSAEGEPNTGRRIHALFEEHFPDREKLLRRSGWTREQLSTIDAYRDGGSIHSYPSRVQIASWLGGDVSWRFCPTADYPLAERCPLLVIDFPA